MEQQLIHDRECLHCVKWLECEGKPEDVKRCVKYEENKEYGEVYRMRTDD